MIQEDRVRSINDLIASIEMGVIVSLDNHASRFIFRELLEQHDPAHCAICNVPLIGRQTHFCSGHWDYVVADIPLSQPYHEVLRALVNWLKVNLYEPTIVRSHAHWLGVVKGRVRCEMCGRTTSVVEMLQASDGTMVKRHTVCEDHAFARSLRSTA